MVNVDLIHHPACTSPNHRHHLCSLLQEGMHYSRPAEFRALVQDARFRCGYCARTARDADKLCEPVEL